MEKGPIRVLHMIGSLDVGGSQAMIMNIYRKIDKSKIQFDFIVDHDQMLFYEKEILELGGKVYILPTFKGWNFYEIYKSWNAFFKAHTEYSIIHFHVRSYISILIPIAKKFGLKVISHSHSTSNGTGIIASYKNVLQLPIRNQADYFFACSVEAGMWLFGPKILNSSFFIVIKNAIDGKKYYFNKEIRNKVRSELGITEDCILLGNVGRLTEAKNQEFLIDIFNEYQRRNMNSKLIIVGEGEKRRVLEEKINKLNLQDSCILIGNSACPEIYYQAMDLFVFPSKWEGLGMAAIEAQASGLYCLVSDNVPKLADINSNLIEFIPLENGKKFWVNKLLDIKVNRESQEKSLNKSGYEIHNTVLFLEKFYTKLNNVTGGA